MRMACCTVAADGRSWTVHDETEVLEETQVPHRVQMVRHALCVPAFSCVRLV